MDYVTYLEFAISMFYIIDALKYRLLFTYFEEAPLR